jgi:DNA-binding MarR family transcriptional regulator
MVNDWAGGELAIALRRMVFASERYRLRVARALMGMGATEMIALGLLAVDGACTPTELAARLQLSTGAITGLVDRLEAAGLAQRRRHVTDRRKVMVELTQAGVGTTGVIQAQLSQAMRRCTATFSGEERAVVLRFLHDAATELDAIPTPTSEMTAGVSAAPDTRPGMPR